MKFIKPKESDKILYSYLREIKNSDDAIKQFISFYQNYKVKAKLAHKEEDMLLFEYTNYNWLNGNEKEFSFILTRQYEIQDDDEFLQLSLTLFFDSKQIGKIESFNSWSIESKDLNQWEILIKNTTGYKLTKNHKPKRIEIILHGT